MLKHVIGFCKSPVTAPIASGFSTGFSLRSNPDLSGHSKIRKEILIGGSIFLFALLLRVVYLIQLRGSPLFDAPIMDALYHHQWATRLAGGEWMGNEAFFRAPLYPYFLGVIYKLFGQNFLTPRLIQLIIGAVSCVLIWLIGSNLFNTKVGVVSGLVASVYGPSIYFEGELLIVPLMLFFSLLSIWLLLKERYFWAGVVLGMAAITRPNILLFIGFVPLLIYFFTKKIYLRKSEISRQCRDRLLPKSETNSKIRNQRPILPLFLPWIGVLLFIIPVTLRNWAVSKDFVFIASQGGVNFYIGNNTHSDGITAVVPGTRATWWGGFYDVIRIAETETGKELKPSEVSNFWFKKGFSFIREDPFLWMKLMIRKIWIFWQGWEAPNNKDIYYFSTHSPLLKTLIWNHGISFPFGLLAPLALCGIFVATKEWSKHIFTFGFIFLYTASVVVFFVCSRYRIPVIAFLIPYASFFAVWLWEGICHRDKKWIPCAVSFSLLVALFNSDFLHLHKIDYASSNFVVGSAYSKKGMYKEALKYLYRAVEEDPKLADVYNNIGNVYARQDMDEEAIRAYTKAIEVKPCYEKTYFNLGSLWLKHMEYERALNYYLKAGQLDPGYELAFYYAGVVYSKMGKTSEALSMWQRVIEINPKNSRAIQKIEKLHHQMNLIKGNYTK